MTRVAALGSRQCGDLRFHVAPEIKIGPLARKARLVLHRGLDDDEVRLKVPALINGSLARRRPNLEDEHRLVGPLRSEEQTSELQSLMRTSYAVFCLKKQK